MIIGSGIILIFAAIILIFILMYEDSEPLPRFLTAVAIAGPIALVTIQLFPRFLSAHKSKITKLSQNIHSYIVIRETALSISEATFNKKDLRATQAILLAGIFILYFLLPKLEPLYQSAGLTEINGVPTHEFIARFREITNGWSIPGSGSEDELLKFVFGNQGLVLLFLSWSLTSMINMSGIGNRLIKVPRLSETKLSKFFTSAHYLLFLFYFLPFIIFFSYLIPYLGSRIVGYSIAIIIGAFAFNMFIHKTISYLLSLSYLVAVLVKTDTCKDCVCINSSPADELSKLPGVGKKLAQKIISNRPYLNIHDIMKVEGFGADKFRIIKDFIRV